MSKGVEHYKSRIIAESFAKFYASDNTAMLDYPLRLGNAKKGSSSPTIAEKSDYILDSGIGNENVGNREVFERGKEIDADKLVPADVLNSPGETTERVVELFEMLNGDDGYSAEVIVPLQCGEGVSHADHYESLRGELSDIGVDITNHRLAVGGIKDWDFPEQLRALALVREHVGLDIDIHGFGMGADWNWLVAIRKCPWLVDSFDNSTNVKMSNNGSILNPQLERIDYRLPRGKNSTCLYSMIRESIYYMVSYLITPFVRDTDAPEKFRIDDDELIESIHVLSNHREWKESGKMLVGE